MMFDHLGESTTGNHDQSHCPLESQTDTATNGQTNVDFNSILQELKSVGQVHQVEAEPMSQSDETRKSPRNRCIYGTAMFSSVSCEVGLNAHSCLRITLLGSDIVEGRRNEIRDTLAEVQTRNGNDHQREKDEEGHPRWRLTATDSD